MVFRHYFLFMILLCCALSAKAQSPQAFNYQAVVRDAQGTPLSNQTMNFEVSIVQNNAVVYGETQTKTTNQFGLVDIKVGQGSAFQNTFSGINWGNGSATIRVKVNGVALPESPILSVPYALYALKSGGSTSDSWTASGADIYRENGNVGIGIQNPSVKLEVNTSIMVSAKTPTGYTNVVFTNPQGGFKYFELDPFNNFYLYDRKNTRFNFMIKDNGMVGIGTTTPQTPLDVAGNISCGARMFIGRNGTEGPGNSVLHFKNGTPNNGGFIRASQSDSDDGNAPLHYEALRHNFYGGNVSVPVLEIRGGSDIVEKFKSNETLEKGILVTIDETDIHNYKTTDKAYQKGIVGIVSGANGVKHGMLLEQDDALAGNTKVAIAGRVYVKATAQNGAIKAGDLLTSSDKAGYAMKATNRRKAYGTVIGKALTTLKEGEGYVLVLVGLQ